MLASWRQRLSRPPRMGPYPAVRWLHLLNAFIFLFATIADCLFDDARLYRIGLPLLTIVWVLLFAAESVPVGKTRLAGYLRLASLPLALLGGALLLTGGLSAVANLF